MPKSMSDTLDIFDLANSRNSPVSTSFSGGMPARICSRSQMRICSMSCSSDSCSKAAKKHTTLSRLQQLESDGCQHILTAELTRWTTAVNYRDTPLRDRTCNESGLYNEHEHFGRKAHAYGGGSGCQMLFIDDMQWQQCKVRTAETTTVSL